MILRSCAGVNVGGSVLSSVWIGTPSGPLSSVRFGASSPSSSSMRWRARIFAPGEASPAMIMDS